MSNADLSQFRQYADEALRWAVQSKNEKETQALIELARAWTQAAANSPPERGPCEFALVGGLGERSCHLAMGIEHNCLAVFASSFDGGPT